MSHIFHKMRIFLIFLRDDLPSSNKADHIFPCKNLADLYKFSFNTHRIALILS